MAFTGITLKQSEPHSILGFIPKRYTFVEPILRICG